ncbi:hypothetical protein SLS55_010605 [Diplodia seriata]|uniref:Cell wall galactomannoprotein n=1 Tax=Diplodia seriata TaxID=420778 RepID=A0A1S8BKH2_9PEZI|nr:hypothetical protein BK809_0008070 [Diplodia seriata]
MRLSPITLLFAAAAAAASPPLTKRIDIITADTLIQDITNIHTGVLANTRATEAYSGSGGLLTSLIQGAPVLATVGAIHVANRKGFADANLSPAISQPDTARVFQHTQDTVAVSIPASVQALKAKRTAFEADGMGAVVVASLRLLLNDHDTFSAALTAKAYVGNETLTAQGEAIVDGIHDAIQSGIDAFNSA